MITLVSCTRCAEQKPVTEFFRDKRKKSGLQSWCRACMKFNSKRHYLKNPAAMVAKARDWTRRNPDKARASKTKSRFSRYGITQAEFLEMVERQSGVCAICKNPEKLVVDHCHVSGKVRGALCQKCNKGIGLLGDDPDRAIAAAVYLREHRND